MAEAKKKDDVYSRGWCFTDHNVIQRMEMTPNFYNFDYSYIIYGLETCPTTGKMHHQGYVYFKHEKSFTKVTKLLPKCHIEKAFGSPQQNYDYCSKEGTFWEDGQLPKQGRRKDLDDIKEDIKKGVSEEKIADENFSQWVQYRHAFADYRNMIRPKRNWKSYVKVIWGGAGSGKTRQVMEEIGDKNYDMCQFTQGGFIIGYTGADIVVFDDFDCRMPRDVFLTLTDRYHTMVNVKGGSMLWNPKTIYFTSNYNPENWYGDVLLESDPENIAVKRRLDEIIKK